MAFQTKGFQWFYGLGGHVASYRGADYYKYYKKGRVVYYEYYDDRAWAVGVDGIIGLEYLLSDIPFTIGIDAKPYAELYRGDGYINVDGALSVRYAF